MYREFARGKMHTVVPAALFLSTSLPPFYALFNLLDIMKDLASRKLRVVAI